MLDTKTKPEPHKTVADLWFDLRVSSQYGSLWEPIENAIASRMERQINSPLARNDDIRDALALVRQSAARCRPSIEDFDPDPGFRREELGEGTEHSYWNTQATFPTKNRKRLAEHARQLAELERARQVLSRSFGA